MNINPYCRRYIRTVQYGFQHLSLQLITIVFSERQILKELCEFNVDIYHLSINLKCMYYIIQAAISNI